MSITEVHEGEEFNEISPVEESGSLSERMAARADVLEQQQTDWFPIPGWEGLLEVELRALGYKSIRATIERNKRVRDIGTRELYSLADQIAKATVGFREVEGEKTKGISDDWVSLARRLPNAPDDLNTRKAILFLVGDKRLHFLVEEWGEWARSIRKDVDEEVSSDFGGTG